MSSNRDTFDVIVVGGGHAGVEAAWAAANLGASVALITIDPAKIGVMSCNPAIGGLAKGQMVREIDAMGGLMGLAADATGIQFRVLNATKGPAVRGPRCQSDKHAYAGEVRRLIASRANVTVLAGTVESFTIEGGVCRGVVARCKPDDSGGQRWVEAVHRGLGSCCGAEADPADGASGDEPWGERSLRASSVVLTTGTFMRGLMHTGERKTAGGRVGEKAATGISGALRSLGFELGRLKTGTPPRLDAKTVDFAGLEPQPGDESPQPFSDLTPQRMPSGRFPALTQVNCWITRTDEATHEAIRANLHRAPMYNGQIHESAGPRYCPSIEDKVVRFADKPSHHVFLEPECLSAERDGPGDEIYCNGISTSLPADVQRLIVSRLPGCENARILRYGYAVEYDMVWPHQVDATGMTKNIPGLFLAGQINGTSGYEEAAAQGLIAGLNAVRLGQGRELIRLGRDEAYLGVLMDDLVTKTPREPYRMFTSRAEHRLNLRPDNADVRLTPLARQWGLIDDERWLDFEARQMDRSALLTALRTHRVAGQRMSEWVKRPRIGPADVRSALPAGAVHVSALSDRVVASVLAEIQYAGYIERQQREIEKMRGQEAVKLPTALDYDALAGLRGEARQTLKHFRPATLGQASRLAGINPADVMVLAVALGR